MRKTCSSITCPVFVLQGSEDEHATVQHAVDLAAAVPKGQVKILEGANHMIPQKYSTIFNQILIDALMDFQKVKPYV